MSLFNTLNTGASGLAVSSTSLGVIGDNIANVNTTGYKSGSSHFSDLMPNDISGLGGTYQVGMGARLSQVHTGFGQGSLEATSSVLDMGISGGGFFVVSSGESDYYSRDGTFFMDSEGYIVNSGGLRLQGHQANDGALTSLVGDLQLDTEPVPGQQTSEVSLNAILSAESEYLDAATGLVDTPLANLNIAGGGVAIEDAATESDYSTSLTIYDSLGVAHEVTMLYERVGANDWTWTAVVDAGETAGAAPGDEGTAFEIASGTMTFDTDGTLLSSTQTNTATAWNYEGAADMTIDFLYGADATGTATDGNVTMAGDENTVTALSQDGYSYGDMTSVSVSSDGTIEGTYTNGEKMILGQVVLATFPSDAGLDRMGGNLFTSTHNSGDVAVGAPDTGGRGLISGYTLEKSNVNLEQEFVSMIEAQRSYQANARVITTADDTLQELVNLV